MTSALMEESHEKAYAKAVGLLARREYSQQELLRKLQSKGFGPEAVAHALYALVDRELQSDQRFAELYTRRCQQKGYGPRYIAVALRNRGLSSDTIEAVLQAPEIAWDIALAVARRKCPYTHNAAIRQWLFRRGFSVTAHDGI